MEGIGGGFGGEGVGIEIEEEGEVSGGGMPVISDMATFYKGGKGQNVSRCI